MPAKPNRTTTQKQYRFTETTITQIQALRDHLGAKNGIRPGATAVVAKAINDLHEWEFATTRKKLSGKSAVVA